MFYGKLTRRLAYEKSESGDYFAYKKYRSSIAEDCLYKCVYCDSHQDMVGGFESMEMDHFRPWQKKFADGTQKFLGLKDDPQNLVHACGVCNGYKWAHWPTEDPAKAYDHEKGWVNPFDEIRNEFLDVAADGTLIAKKAPATYQIKQLRLNRPLLKRHREMRLLLEQIDKRHKALWEKQTLSKSGDEADGAQASLVLLELVRQLVCPS